MKYNKSEIMKAAWRFFRAMKCSFSEALKSAWKSAKSGRGFIRVKAWFYDKMSREAAGYRMTIDVEYNGGMIDTTNGYVTVLAEERLAETEKAVKVRLSTGLADGSFKGWTTWIPKSVIA